MPFALDDQLRVSSAVVFRNINGEGVLLHVDRGIYFGLDPIGTRVWEALVEHGCARPVMAPLLAEFDVTPAVLETDVLRLLGELAEQELIHPRR